MISKRYIHIINLTFIIWKGSNFKPTKLAPHRMNSHEFCEVVVPGACYLEMILAGVKAHLGAQVRKFANLPLIRWLETHLSAHFSSFSKIWAGSLVHRKPGLCQTIGLATLARWSYGGPVKCKMLQELQDDLRIEVHWCAVLYIFNSAYVMWFVQFVHRLFHYSQRLLSH